MEDDLFSLDTVRDFIISKGGKVKNHELVAHFKRYLNDPHRQVANRGKFKDYVNTLAAVRLDQSGEKLLVLKKKYRESGGDVRPAKKAAQGDSYVERPKKRPPKAFPAALEGESSTDAEPAQSELQGVGAAAAEAREATPEIHIIAPDDEDKENIAEESMEEGVISIDGAAGESMTDDQPPSEGVVDLESSVGDSMTEERSDFPESMATSDSPPSLPSTATSSSTINEDSTDAVKLPAPEWDKEPPAVKLPAPAWDRAPPSTPATAPTPNKGPPMSVKERAKHLNKMQSDSDLSQSLLKSTRKQDKQSKGTSDDDSNSVSSVGTITLDAAGREWMITCSTGDYQAIYKLLNKNQELAKRKDFITNALHWASKHGNADVIKLLCGTGLLNVNARSGYTALHLAAMHGHEQIIELLVQGYGADPNMRDYSGKKPKQYLRNSASTRAQQLLQPRRAPTHHLTTQPFKRQGSYSTKIQKSGFFGIGAPSAAVRDSWASNASDTASERDRESPSPNPSPMPSPKVQRKSSLPDVMSIMPPPQLVPPRRKKTKKSQSDNASSDSELPVRADSMPNIAHSASDVSLPTSKMTYV